MRLPLSFVAACVMALALFGLMLYMVAPPSSKPSEEPLTVANFVRLDGDSSDTATRTRQQAPQPPQAQTPQTPTPPIRCSGLQKAQVPPSSPSWVASIPRRNPSG